MRSGIVGFVIGVALLQNQGTLPAPYLLAVLVAVALLLGFVARKSRHAVVGIFSLTACGALLGFIWAALVAQFYLRQELPREWEGRDVAVVGTVDSLPYAFQQGVRFNFAVERVLTPGAEGMIPGRLALSWYSAFRADELQAVGKVNPGERWQLTVRLRRPHGNANPDGFDYEAWLLEQGLRATGAVRPDQQSAFTNRRLDEFVFGFGNTVERSRGWLRDRIHDALPDKEYAGVIVALVIGDQRAISQW